MIVAPASDLPHFQRCLGGGEAWGIYLSYAIRPTGGPALALTVAREFAGERTLFLILGDPILYGRTLPATLQKAATLKKGARVFARSNAVSNSDSALTSLGFYDHTAAARARMLASSHPARLEIADLNDTYRAEGTLEVEAFGDDVACMDVPARDALPVATECLRAVEKSRGVKVGCPEEAAWRMGFIDDERLLELAHAAGETEYGRYLRRLPGACSEMATATR